MEQEVGGNEPVRRNGMPEQQPGVEEAVQYNLRIEPLSARGQLEGDFIRALQGERVTEIDRFQVYSDYSPEETVVFIHNPTGREAHKYIFAETAEGHSYIVAAPVSWTAYHREILQRVNAAHGTRARCPGGGYVNVGEDGDVEVYDRSVDFGRGDHERAKQALVRAVNNMEGRELH